jgi:UDP-3-O-[3-hydroxymyristoyl] glucosamine N-acyltransferase
MKLSEVARQINGVLEGNGDIEVFSVGGIDATGPSEISFIANPKYAPLAAKTRAAAVIVPENWDAECAGACIRVKNPDAAFAKATALFYSPPPPPAPGIHPTAVVAGDVELGENVSIGPGCVIEAGVKIGDNTLLIANCYVGYHSIIGSDCRLYPQVSLREFVTIGSRCILHNGSVVGSDGFGYSVDSQGRRTKIPQIGTVEMGDDVEVGANTTIDRARFGTTRIGNGVKMDNLVQIAHNVEIGDHVVLISQAAIAGSTSIGAKTIFAGRSGAAGHLKIGSGVIVGAGSGVTKDVPDGAYVMGLPAMPAAKMKRSHAAVMLLPKMKERLALLEKQVEKLVSGNKK